MTRENRKEGAREKTGLLRLLRPAVTAGVLTVAAAGPGLTVLQLAALFSAPLAVYWAFGLSGHSPWALVGAQALPQNS